MHRSKKSKWFKHLDFIILDLLTIQVALMLASEVRNDIFWVYSLSEYREIAALMFLIDLCVVFLSESYKGILQRGKWKELQETIKHMSLVIAIVFVYMFFVQMSTNYSRVVFFLAWGFMIVLSYITRIIVKRILRKSILKRDARAIVLIVTMDKLEETVAKTTSKIYRDYTICGAIVLDEKEIEQIECKVPIIGNKEEGMEYLKTAMVDEVLINVSGSQIPQKIVNECTDMGIIVHYCTKQLGKDADESVKMEQFAGLNVCTISIKEISYQQMFFKRIIDVVGAVFGMILTGMIFFVIAPAIKIQSPGPVFFKQKRIGKNGRQFFMYKFRTMSVGAENEQEELKSKNEMKGPMFKIRKDPRVFPLGKRLRESSLDEFPQFLNVLKGDMSLVGTRPPTVEEYEQYDAPHKKRLAMKPGITGLWQVSGRNDIVDFEEVVKLDTEYLKNWNLGMDIEILLKTVIVVLKRRGAV